MCMPSSPRSNKENTLLFSDPARLKHSIRKENSWTDINNTLLRNFFDDARVEDLRSKIATFTHEPAESFRSSWIRFKSYQRDCPHHGFNETQLLLDHNRHYGI